MSSTLLEQKLHNIMYIPFWALDKTSMFLFSAYTLSLGTVLAHDYTFFLPIQVANYIYLTYVVSQYKNTVFTY